MSRTGTWIGRLSTVLLVAAAAVFITRTVVANSRQLADFSWNIRPHLLALSLVAHVGVLAWGVFVWSRVLRHFSDARPGLGRLLEIWALSNAARYIPGVVWQFFAAARLGTSSGLSTTLTLTSMLVHLLFSLGSAALVAVATLPLQALLGIGPDAALMVRLAVCAAVLVAIHPGLINWAIRLAHRVLKRQVLPWNAGWSGSLALLGLGVVSWALYGVAFYLFLTSLAPLPFSALPAASGVNALSFVAGLVIPVPGGLGVRESAMTLLLAPLLPVGVAAVIAVAARLWSIAAEIGLIVLSLFFRRPAPAEETIIGG